MNNNNVIYDYLSSSGIFSALKYTIYIIFNAPYSKHRNPSIDLQGRIFIDFEIDIGESFKKKIWIEIRQRLALYKRKLNLYRTSFKIGAISIMAL